MPTPDSRSRGRREYPADLRRTARSPIRRCPLHRPTRASLGAFATRIKVRTWSGTTYNAFDAVGDVNGDGRADFLARTPGGTLYLYKGTGKATSEIFDTRISVGGGFDQYDIFG